jgi:PAS domain S-box-containing protein
VVPTAEAAMVIHTAIDETIATAAVEIARHQQEMLRAIVEQSGEGIIAADERGVLRLFNAEAERQHGVSLRMLAAHEWPAVDGPPAADRAPPFAPEQTPLYRGVQGEFVKGAQFRVRRPDGAVRELTGTVAPLRHADGSAAGAVMITRDETEARAAETALARARRDRDETLALLDTFMASAPSGQARGIPLAPRRVDLAAVCAALIDALQAVRPERAVALDVPAECVGRWDPDRIAQVVNNLLANALDCSPPDAPVRVQLACDEREATLAVHNAGEAIPRAALPTLFEPFRRGLDAARAEGTPGGPASGLYLAAEIVRAHGGTIQVRSESASGTTFTVRLPRGDPTAP